MPNPSRPRKKMGIQPRMPAATVSVPRSSLLTEDQVLTRLRTEIDAESLTAVAARYGIKVSQLSDIMYGRANLSKRVTERLRYRLVKLYEKLHDGERA